MRIPTILFLALAATANVGAEEGAKARPQPDTAALEKAIAMLTPIQHKVTQEDGTEPPFRNAYWDNKRDGVYVCIISGAPLFSSKDKFDSGTGWPSFTRPIAEGVIEEKEDRSHFMVRTEVRSLPGRSHLGHVFPDGPAPTGLRYCINSAALRFIPAEDLAAEGYADLAAGFQHAAEEKQ